MILTRAFENEHLFRFHLTKIGLPLESFIPDRQDPSGKRLSNNIARLREFVTKSSFLHSLLFRSNHPVLTDLFQIIQVVFTHWSLDLSLNCPTYSFEISQKAVYSHPNKTPMFKNKMSTVNVNYLLHIVNFFKYHITCKEEGTLQSFFEELAEDQKPRAWENHIDQGLRKVGTTWLGTYGKSS